MPNQKDTGKRGFYLCSIKEMTGYHIQATDGEMGHLDDFMVEDMDLFLKKQARKGLKRENLQAF